MSQIVDYNDKDLEKLSLYARNLRPMLRETILMKTTLIYPASFSAITASKIRQQHLALQENSEEYKLEPVRAWERRKRKTSKPNSVANRASPKRVIHHRPTHEKDMVNYAYTISDKVRENNIVMQQIENNNAEQAMLGDFPAP
jgi:type I restriction enzyme R subunit